MKTVINKHTREVKHHTVKYDIVLSEDEELVDFIPDNEVTEIKIVPETVTRRQLRQALILSDFDLTIIDKFINSVEDEKERLILDNYWNASTEFERNHPILIDFSNNLNFTTEQINDLFISANTL
jgi:hypothetical protein